MAFVMRDTRILGSLLRRWSLAIAMVAGVVLLTAPACVQKGAEPGPLGGPSELGLALTLTASPDMLPLDGAAQSLVGILARNEDGASVPNLRLSLQISTSRGIEDFGRLSTRSLMTGADGRAGVTYTAPLTSTNPAGTSDLGTTVDILVTPIGDDFSNAISRSVTIRLVPVGSVIPPFNVAAGFRFTPQTPAVFDQVRFETVCETEASTDCVRDPGGIITQYAWDFGDGGTAAGPSVTHVYEVPGTFVARLTVSDNFNRSVQVTRSIVVADGTPPTAAFTISPSDPEPNDRVFFNAEESTPGPGRTIVSYEWDFGDGGMASGITTSHVYTVEGTFVVTLTVTDDRGQKGATTATVTAKAIGPTAAFVFSPAEPEPNDRVFFDAFESEAGNGRRIVRYRWNFVDGTRSEGGVNVGHRYSRAGTYTVQLTVTNNLSETDTATEEVPVGVVVEEESAP